MHRYCFNKYLKKYIIKLLYYTIKYKSGTVLKAVRVYFLFHTQKVCQNTKYTSVK